MDPESRRKERLKSIFSVWDCEQEYHLTAFLGRGAFAPYKTYTRPGELVADICAGSGTTAVAAISKELLHWTDTYVIDVADGRDGLCALMVVLAIDAEKCSRNS